MKLLPFERDATAQELYERSARRCPLHVGDPDDAVVVDDPDAVRK